MPSNPFKAFLKTINTDRNFNIESFLANDFGSFWGLFYDYIQKLAITPSKDGLFKRSKFAGFKQIYNALQKVIPETKAHHYKDEFFPLINKIFCNFFHPETSTPIRTQMMGYFFMIISKLSQEQIDKFSNALSLLVPYYRYSSSDEGIQKIKSIIIDPLSLSPIIDPSAPVGTQEDCVVDLKRFLQFIKENWDSNTINAIQLLNEHVLNVIFKGVLSTQNITAKSIGFSGLPPYTFYHIIIEFFYGLTGSKFDFVKFLSYNRNSLLLLGISGLSITYKNQADLISSIEILIYIYCSNYYIEILQNDDPNFAYNVCNTFISLLTYVYSDDSNFQSNSKFTTSSFVFVGEYVKTITQFFGEEKAIDIIVQLFTDNPSHITSLGFIMMNLLNHYISNKNWSNIVWEKLVYLIVKSDALSAITAHYAQYLAVYSFPYEFEINFEEAREACTNHKRRKQRTRQSTPHDYIAENFEMIVKKPEEFVHKNIKAYYEPFNQYEKMISKIQIIPLTFSDKQNIKTLLISFLDTFSNYKTFETPNQEENCFAIIISFCQMFVQLRLIPTTIQYNRSAPYALCSRRLFNSILTQNNQQIRKMSFSILSDLINHIEIEPYLTNIDYSNWYASLILMMLSRFEECREMGFQASVVTLQNSFEGSTMLTNIMLNLCEKELIPINESYISFITSIPLFKFSTNFPDNYINSLIKLIESDSYNYIDDYLNMFKGNNSRERCINFIFKLQEIKDWKLILPAYSILIADELSQQTQNVKVIIKILDFLLEAINDESIEAIFTIQSLLNYSETFQELIPKEYLRFIETMTDITIKLDEKETSKETWQFYLIQLVSNLYIYNYKITHSSNYYQKYCEFLSTSSKKKLFSNNINSLINNLISLLTIYYGGYPFPQTSSFPTHHQPTIKEKGKLSEIFSTSETIIHPYYNQNDEVEIAFQGISGNFVYKFKGIDSQLYKEQQGTPVNVPVTTTNENIIPSIENEYEKEFNDVFNQLLSDYKEEFKEESFETDIFPTDDYHLNSIIEEIDNNTEITSNDDNTIKLPYPVIIPTNSIAGALTACGRYPLNHPENFFHLDPNTSATIEKLQKETHRLGVKIGVVYVGPNVENQNQILATTIEETSTHFKEFILGLGWPIELRTHSGYDGGMDLNRNGTTSIYYSDFLDEIMFHIAPLIPTDYKDEQQIYKKRHIGNDHIHIVWCEQGKDYDITTITSQFNKAHIVIYPLNTGLFHVDIHWRNEELGWFGPLRYSIVVNKTILPALVRETSVSAMKSFYFSQELTRFATPQNEIAKTVATVIPKCDKKKEKKEQDKSVSLEPLEALMNIEPQN